MLSAAAAWDFSCGKLQASQHRYRDEFAGLVVEHTGVEDVPEDESAQDLHQLRIVVGRLAVARSEQSLIGGLGVSLAFGQIGFGHAGDHVNHCWSHANDPSSTA